MFIAKQMKQLRNSFYGAITMRQDATTLTVHKFNIYASKEFWYCNIAGWICFIYINSLQAYFYGGLFYAALTNTAKAAALGTLALLFFRYIHFKRQWNQCHPMELIPVIVLVSTLFASFITFLTFTFTHSSPNFHFLTDLFAEPRDQVWFGSVVGYFITYLYAMLAWLMLYVFIQAESAKIPAQKLSARAFIFAVLTLLAMQQLLQLISAIAYYNPEGFLFSFHYFSSFFWGIAFSLLLSLYIYLIKPGEQLAQSRLLPLLPMVSVLIFCSSVFSMWAFKLTPYIPELVTSIPLDAIAPYLARVFSEPVPLWGKSDEFSGLFHVKFNEQFITALFLLYCNFSRVWKKHENNTDLTEFNIGKSLQFWLYNFGGWSTAGLYLYFSDLLELEQADKHLPQIFIFSFIVIGAFLGALLRSLMKRIQLENSSLIVFTYKVILLSLLFGVLHTCALTMVSYIYIYGVLGDQALISRQHIFSGSYYFYKTLAWFSVCFVVWSLIYEISVSQRNKSLNALKQLQLEKNIKEAQLNTLAGKIDPHFIFNALNNIRSLIREDGEKAREAILILSDILRSPIAQNTQNKIPLAEEILLLRNYIALSKIQLERRLHYQEMVAEEVQSALIPPMMLQILVENAIKHGISQLQQGGILWVHISKREQTLVCRVSNSGSLQYNSSTQGFGIGVKNIKERLSLLYGNSASFSLEQNQDTVIAELTLPLEYYT